jgi:mitogen-activated protein kinase kinase 7
MSLPIIPTKKPVDTAFDEKLKKINERNGLLHINGTFYKTSQNDLEDLGELGNGTSGHVVKMRHKDTGEIIAVKVSKGDNNQLDLDEYSLN